MTAQRYETQITVWFEADNAEDAVAIAARLEARVNEHPSAHVNCVVTRAFDEGFCDLCGRPLVDCAGGEL